MAILMLRLIGPMQSWGTTSRFTQRDTGNEPSKSGVIGILAAAIGIDRGNWTDLEPLTRLKMAVRHDRSGLPARDYQTAGCAGEKEIIRADGSLSNSGVISNRFYITDGAFLVGLEGEKSVLIRAYESLKNPMWPLCLGRKSYVPSEPIRIEGGLLEETLIDTVSCWPWISSLRKREEYPEKLLLSYETGDGSGVLRMDQLLSSFVDRQFGARFVHSEWIPFPKEKAYVPA